MPAALQLHIFQSWILMAQEWTVNICKCLKFFIQTSNLRSTHIQKIHVVFRALSDWISNFRIIFQVSNIKLSHVFPNHQSQNKMLRNGFVWNDALEAVQCSRDPGLSSSWMSAVPLGHRVLYHDSVLVCIFLSPSESFPINVPRLMVTGHVFEIGHVAMGLWAKSLLCFLRDEISNKMIPLWIVLERFHDGVLKSREDYVMFKASGTYGVHLKRWKVPSKQ